MPQLIFLVLNNSDNKDCTGFYNSINDEYGKHDVNELLYIIFRLLSFAKLSIYSSDYTGDEYCEENNRQQWVEEHVSHYQ